MAKYQKAIQWIKDLLFNIEFSMDRLKIIASKMMSDVNQMKRDGDSVVSAVSTSCCFEKGRKLSGIFYMEYIIC